MNRFTTAAATAGLLTFAAACGGGGGGGSSQPIPVASNVPGPVATSATTTFTSQAQSSTVNVPAVAGYSGTIQVPPANAATSVSLTVSTSLPPGVAPLPSATPPPGGYSNYASPLLYFSVTPSAAVTFSGLPSLTLTLPSSVNTQQAFYVAAYVPNLGWNTFTGQGVVQGSTVTVTTLGATGSLSLGAGQTAVLAFYAGTVLVGAPPLTVTPAQVSLLDLTASQTVTLADSIAGSQLSIDGSSCNGIAQVSALSAGAFTVSAVALGTCSVSVKDNYSNSFNVPVSVSTSTVIVK